MNGTNLSDSTNNLHMSSILCNVGQQFLEANSSFYHPGLAALLNSSNISCPGSEGHDDEVAGMMDPVSVWIRLAVLILYGIVCIVGLCGNTLVIYVVIRFSKMHTVTNLYIVNLAIADECFLVGLPFLMTTTAVEYWPFGQFMCKMYLTTTGVNQVTSSMFLLIMSADRFIAVCHPISATKWRTPMISTIVIVTAWVLSAVIMVPIFIFGTTRTFGDNISCNIYWPVWMDDKTFMYYSFLVTFFVPFILISIFYVLVIFRLRHVGPKRAIPQAQLQSVSTTTAVNRNNCNNGSAAGPTQETPAARNSTSTTVNARSKDRKRSHRKVTKLVLTVITVYFLCWAPYWGLQLALASMENEITHSTTLLTIFLLAACLSYSNSAMNPILYAFLSDNFKKSFMKACSCANRRDVNAMLHGETSAVLPRNKSSERLRKRKAKNNQRFHFLHRFKNNNGCNGTANNEFEGNGLLMMTTLSRGNHHNHINGGPNNNNMSSSPSEIVLLRPIEETEILESPMIEGDEGGQDAFGGVFIGESETKTKIIPNNESTENIKEFELIDMDNDLSSGAPTSSELYKLNLVSNGASFHKRPELLNIQS